jgi:GntR family transcriptional repressor for pyruvate dehydrogenase complex
MGYSPSPIRRDSVISQAAQEICRYIEAERLAPGEALPPETRLSQMLGISRNSLREALRVLHGLGHVEKTAGRRVVVTAAGQGGKSVFDQSVLVEAAPVANEVRSHIAQKCAELSAERITNAELGELDAGLAELETAIARQDINAAKAAHDSFHAFLLASARNPLLVAMFNQAQVARLSNVAPAHKGFYDPRHLAHHRALLRALRRRDARAAAAAVRRHYRSLGLMLAVVSRTRRKPGGSRTENEGAPVAADAVAYARPARRGRPKIPSPM